MKTKRIVVGMTEYTIGEFKDAITVWHCTSTGDRASYGGTLCLDDIDALNELANELRKQA